MADMLHWIRIEADPDAVFRAVTTEEGLRGWWTNDVEARPEVGSVARFGFNSGAVVFRMRIDEITPDEHLRWTCLGDFDEWEGTELEFRMVADDGGTSVHFTHAGWISTEGYYRQCNTDWGRLMYYLKDYVETGRPRPMMS